MTSNLPVTQGQARFLPLSTVFAQAPIEDLGEGIRAALAQLSIAGNVFSIKHHGVTEQLPPAQARQVEVVIVKSAKTQSKAYWPGGYKPGSDKPPVCWSSNSVTPDAQVPAEQKQNSLCATCKNDVFVVGANGLKSKLCGDHKRLAVVPVEDLHNEAYGGAMIFRVPAGSLGAIGKYGQELKQYNVPYYAYTTYITLILDPQKQTTKLQFDPGRPLGDEEALIIKEMREDERSGRIVNEVLIGFEETELGEQPIAQQPPKAAAPIVKSTPGVPSAAERIATQAESRQAQPMPSARPVARENTPAGAAQIQSAINQAVGRPTAPPPSQRPVQQTVPIVETVTAEEVGSVPNELDDLFGDLVNQK